MSRKIYQKPTTKVVQLHYQCHILAGSNSKPTSASFDDYEEDNTFSW